MKNLRCLLVFVLLAFLASQSVLAKSHRHRNGSTEGGRRNNNKNGGRNGRNKNEGFRCPVMTCPPVSPTCQEVEYLVLHFAEANSAVTFQCRGCDYCLDYNSLQKRDAVRRHHGMDNRRHLRHAFRCPGVHETCADQRPVEVRISGVPGRSWSCPACFDDVQTKH